MIEVLITDSNSPDYYQNYEYYQKIDQWARTNCASYAGYHVQDVSDYSPIWDEIACYKFSEDKCATWFRLMWS